MRVNSGFLLVEIIVYLTLSVSLVMVCYGVASRIHLQMSRLTKKRDTALYGALQLLRRELMSAPGDLNSYTTKTDSLTYTTKGAVITWNWQRNQRRLVRHIRHIVKESYDSTAVLDDVESFSLGVKKDINGTVFFALNMGYRGIMIVEYITSRNRVIRYHEKG